VRFVKQPTTTEEMTMDARQTGADDGRLAHRWRVLIVVSAAVFMASLDLFIVNIAFPDIAKDFAGNSLGDLSWILNAYAIVFAALLVPAGRTADRLGRKRSFIAGLVLFTTASALAALAPSVELLVAARVLQAVGAASLLPTSLALLLPEFPPAERRTAVAVWAAVGGVAAAAGPPIGGVLVQAGWQLVFLVNVPIGIVLLVAAVRVLREAREPEGTPAPDLAGAFVLTAAIGVLTFGIVKAADWGWGSTRVVVLLAGSVVLLALFWARSARHPAPVVEPELLRKRTFALANAGALLFFMAFGAMLLASVLFLTEVWGESVLTAGLEIAPGPAMAAVFSVPSARLSARYGERVTGALGALLFASGGVWWLTELGASPDYAGAFLPGMLIGGAGVGLVIPTLFAAATAALPPARFATGSAVLSMSRQIGVALGVAVLVSLIGAPGRGDALAGFQDGWTFMVASALAAAVALASLGKVGAAATVPAPTAPSVAVESA
jgi:EmrB/QacA subfamily drug resistance transporter